MWITPGCLYTTAGSTKIGKTPQKSLIEQVHQPRQAGRTFERTRAGSAQAAAQRIKRPRNCPTTDRLAEHLSHSHQKHFQQTGGQQSPGGCPPRRGTQFILTDPKLPTPTPTGVLQPSAGAFFFQQQSQPQSHHVVMTPHQIGGILWADKQRKEKTRDL
jgi:hypothetical protein